MEENEIQSAFSRYQQKTHDIIFEADTPLGKLFDVVLIILIALSVFTVMLDSVESVNAVFGYELYLLEWIFTLIFTFEYALRLSCIQRPARYAVSFFGVIDLLAVLPTYLSIFITDIHYLLVIRVLRVLRVFRVLKIAHYVGEADLLMAAIRGSRQKITIFLLTVVFLATIAGSLMYVIEGPGNGFTSIPTSVYWAIVTLTTVGYGDLAPQTPWGQALSVLIMLMGYGIIAVPTGILSVELARATQNRMEDIRACPSCGGETHAWDARYCKHCGVRLPE